MKGWDAHMGTWILIAAAALSFLFVFLGAVWIGGFFDRYFRPEEEEESENSQKDPPAV